MACRVAADDERLLFMSKRPFAANLAWTLLGNGTALLAKAALLVILARKTNVETVGTYVLALAIASPVQLFSNMRLRSLVASETRDSQEVYASYFRANFITSAAALSLLLAASVILPIGDARQILAAVAFSKCIESFAEIRYGSFQNRGRYDFLAASLCSRAIIGSALFAIVVFVGGSVALAILMQTAGWAVVALLVERRLHHRLTVEHSKPGTSWSTREPLSTRRLIAIGAPLGLSSLFVSLNKAIPQYLIEFQVSSRELGVYGSAAYLTGALGIVLISVGQTALPRFAAAVRAEDPTRVLRQLRSLYLLFAMAGLSSVMAAHLAGRAVLQGLYGADYGGGRNALVVLTAATAVSGLAAMADSAAIALRSLTLQPLLTLCTAAVTGLTAYFAINAWGITGASIGMLIGAAFQVVVFHLLVRAACARLGAVRPDALDLVGKSG